MISVESLDCSDDAGLFVWPDLRVDGQCEHLSGGGFADREVASFIPQMSESGLLMERQGIVDFAADLVIAEILPELITARRANDVLVEDMGCAGVDEWEDDPVRNGVRALRID